MLAASIKPGTEAGAGVDVGDGAELAGVALEAVGAGQVDGPATDDEDVRPSIAWPPRTRAVAIATERARRQGNLAGTAGLTGGDGGFAERPRRRHDSNV
jgi:hypothetical protein